MTREDFFFGSEVHDVRLGGDEALKLFERGDLLDDAHQAEIAELVAALNVR